MVGYVVWERSLAYDLQVTVDGKVHAREHMQWEECANVKNQTWKHFSSLVGDVTLLRLCAVLLMKAVHGWLAWEW